jgi:hypothetical protein
MKEKATLSAVALGNLQRLLRIPLLASWISADKFPKLGFWMPDPQA